MVNNMDNTILFGNGLNRIPPTNLSWEDLLNKISSHGLINNISNTLQYEDIYLLKKIVPVAHTVSNNDTTEYALKKSIAKSFASYTSNLIYHKISLLPIEHLLTTNYDHVMDLSLEKHGFSFDSSKSDKSEDVYSIHRYRHFVNPSTNQTKRIWSIHGDMDAPKSIMLGYDQYCGYISKCYDFLKGSYTIRKDKVGSIIDRLSNSKGIEIKSWVDFLFITDVHIVGFGLSTDELELWWLLDKRMRYIKEGRIAIYNKIHFYDCDIDSDKKRLLQDFGLTIHEYDKPKDDDYTSLYTQIIDDIAKSI